ncbi:hypothetical protein BDZ94DRAFT_237765 [Collybia nuda]|uniref:Uncharacterized protein n=1 Tax=Collybia nuda TaxID=64659 RepID=A0A9P5XV82_9AGAR|nr:hypothetical protein BDZ94DRAFT_237765 [Collybia nuda]
MESSTLVGLCQLLCARAEKESGLRRGCLLGMVVRVVGGTATAVAPTYRSKWVYKLAAEIFRRITGLMPPICMQHHKDRIYYNVVLSASRSSWGAISQRGRTRSPYGYTNLVFHWIRVRLTFINAVIDNILERTRMDLWPTSYLTNRRE